MNDKIGVTRFDAPKVRKKTDTKLRRRGAEKRETVEKANRTLQREG